MTGRRGYLLALGGLLAGGALTLLALGRPWLFVQLRLGPSAPVTTATYAGSALHPWGAALGVAALAVALAVVATRGFARRLLGLLVVAGAIPLLVLAVTTGRSGPDVAVLTRDYGPVTVVSDGAPATAVGATAVVSGSAWWVLLLVAAGLLAVAGAVTCWCGPQWPVMSRRYERRGAAAPADTTTPQGQWDALDRGEDPTR